VANAGPDRNVATGSLVTLDGSGSSDANGDTLTYGWSFASKPAGSTATLSSATAVNPTFTADMPGAYVLSLVVHDGTVGSAADTVTITAVTGSLSLTLNPVLDFYITRTWYTDTNSLWGYGVDTIGTDPGGYTGSEAGTSSNDGRPFHSFLKLLYNFNISSLGGATIQSASFRIYLYGISGTDTPRNAILENIFYGNTDSFPAPRNYDSEFGGYSASPAISGSVAPTVGWIQFDVTDKLQADIDAGHTNSQIRLSHQEANTWGLNYYCQWRMADFASNKPELVVTYNP
jgi:hypothetical protein